MELGLASAGHRASAFCEIDPEAATVLRDRFPTAALTRDIRVTDEVLASISPSSQLLTGGFPCTDLSQAGCVQGFAGRRSSLVRDAIRLLARHTFPHVLLENVPNWRFLHGGEYLREVVESLEKLGYHWAYRTVDARAFGTPQRRLRIFLYATLEGDPREVLFAGDHPLESVAFDLGDRAHGFYWTEGFRGLGWGEDCVPTLKGGSAVGVPSPPAVLLPDTGSRAAATEAGPFQLITPNIVDAERLQGLPPNWTAASDTIDGQPFRPRRRWMLVGNAVNVRTAAWIGDRLARPGKWDGDVGQKLEPIGPWPAAAWGNGSGRWSVDVGPNPVDAPWEPLAEFLSCPGTPLSIRATRGFLSRLRTGHLRPRPAFGALLEKHLAAMERCEQLGLSALPTRKVA